MLSDFTAIPDQRLIILLGDLGAGLDINVTSLKIFYISDRPTLGSRSWAEMRTVCDSEAGGRQGQVYPFMSLPNLGTYR